MACLLKQSNTQRKKERRGRERGRRKKKEREREKKKAEEESRTKRRTAITTRKAKNDKSRHVSWCDCDLVGSLGQSACSLCQFFTKQFCCST
jgi:hypothetical protein